MENVKIINADAENLPIKDDSDFIWSWGVYIILLIQKNYFRDLQNTKKMGNSKYDL